MIKFIANWFVSAISLSATSYLVSGIHIESFAAALIAVAILSVINLLLKPILIILTLPINILSFGLFTFIINALLLYLAGSLTRGFWVDGLGSALIGSIVYTLIQTVFFKLIK